MCFCAKCVHLFLVDEFYMLFTLCCGFVASKFCFKMEQGKNSWCETRVTGSGGAGANCAAWAGTTNFGAFV